MLIIKQLTTRCKLLQSATLILNKLSYKYLVTTSTNLSRKMDLKTLVKRLNEYAPKELACDWDNVGLLVEPSNLTQVKKILVTNDLTEPVLNEAIKLGANMIISYHPAIFVKLNKLTQIAWKERSIIKCIEKQIAVFTPHTTWDSIDGGMNDWLFRIYGI